MNAIDKILNAVGLARMKSVLPPSIAESASADPFTIWRSSKKVPADKAFEVYAGWVYACIRAIAEEIASMEFKLMEVKKDGTVEQRYEHELLDLLGGVNPNQTGIELKYSTAAHLEATGNAYWYLEGVENETDKPKAIYLLNPARTKPIVDRNSFPSQVQKFEYRTWTKKYEFEPYRILHFKYPDPTDPYEGIGTVQTLAQWIDADNYAMEFNRRFFLNGARLGGFLESESAYTPEQLDYIKKSFEAIYKGVENAHKVVALPKGTTYKEGAQGQKDMDFAQLMDMMRDRILAGFRVPRTVLGITDDVNRANAEATNYVFALRTIKPKMQLIVSYLNEFLVTRYDENIYLDFVDPVPENREQRIEEMRAALGNSASISVNEAREEYFGLPPIDNGDAVMTEFNKVPLGEPDKKRKTDRRTIKQNGKQVKTRAAKNAKVRKSISEELAKKMAESIKEIQNKLKEDITNIANLSDDEFEVIWKQFVGRVTPYEEQMQKTIRKYNAEQKERVIKNLSEAVKAISEKDLLNKKEEVAILIDLTTPLLTDLMEKEGKEAAELLGFGDIDTFTPEAKEALDESIELMAKSYTDTTLGMLKDKLTQGQRDGLSLDELGQLVGEIYEFSDEVRAAQVARTETFRIANEATRKAWEATGVVKTVKWYTAADERVCPYCEPMHGKVISIDDTFFKLGDEVIPNDESPPLKLEYSDVRQPPLHVSCRCYIRPEEISIG